MATTSEARSGLERFVGTWEYEGDRFVMRWNEDGSALEAVGPTGESVPAGWLLTRTARIVARSTEVPPGRRDSVPAEVTVEGKPSA